MHVDLCLAHYLLLLEREGPQIPDYVWQQLGLDTVVKLRAQGSRSEAEGAALGVQLCLCGFCYWCEGPDGALDPISDRPARS